MLEGTAPMEEPDDASAPYRDRLLATRRALLDLHKLLLQRERADYGQDHGPITNARLFDLALNDESFAWLRPILQIVVRIDEMLEWNGLWTDADAEAVLDRTRALLKASEFGTPFEQRIRRGAPGGSGDRLRPPRGHQGRQRVALLAALPPRRSPSALHPGRCPLFPFVYRLGRLFPC